MVLRILHRLCFGRASPPSSMMLALLRSLVLHYNFQLSSVAPLQSQFSLRDDCSPCMHILFSAHPGLCRLQVVVLR
ncbi:hypothetical protein KC19_VG226400 [Ceratodon purpureus]|uniref:Uncharacterized protein n=1 Tax=Ceratodon purpureus TaxID=3225 RepID=A0A8T0HU20_CERPU|nr:hypothetical protein KC19_VG226400 [Ceratodon purpureus]